MSIIEVICWSSWLLVIIGAFFYVVTSVNDLDDSIIKIIGRATIIAFCSAIFTSSIMLAGAISSSPSSSSSSYENNVRNGMKKLTNGRYDDMTEDEKKAAEDFLEWQSKENQKNR